MRRRLRLLSIFSLRGSAMRLALLILVASAVPAVAQAAQVDLRSGASSVRVGHDGAVDLRSGAASVRTGRSSSGRDCHERDVSGSHRRMTFSGTTCAINISGSYNTIRASLTPGARVSLSGSHNRLLWTAMDPGGALPDVASSGTDNRAVRQLPNLRQPTSTKRSRQRSW